MPVPLNPFVDIVRAWFTERLGYLVNDSVPVKPNYKGKPNTPSDIDLVCNHPLNKPQQIVLGNKKIRLSSKVIVECKGWFDFSKTAFMGHLINDLELLEKHKMKFLPKNLTKEDYYFFFLRDEVYQKAKLMFGTSNFQRIIIGPYLQATRNSSCDISNMIKRFNKKDITILEMSDILHDLFAFISSAIEKKENKISTEDADKLRKNYAIEFLHLVSSYCDIRKK